MAATHYLNRLGLDTAADERAIKRAYARELKQIDQEADAAGFQVLRQAYEMALQWVKHKPAGISFAPAGVVPVVSVAVRELEARTRPAAPTDASARSTAAETNENPQQLAQAVFDDFLVLCGEMVEQGKGRDSQMWRKHLQRCANDERLLNLTAGAYFEHLIARLLVDGWRNGHEGLFVAARQVFLWEKDRRRLVEFGRTGARLNQAIDECEMFTHQKSGDCSGQIDAVARVREDDAPSKSELITHAPHLRNMMARFPAWTGIIASRERIQEWLDQERMIPRWRRTLSFAKSASSGEKSGSIWWRVGLCLFTVRLLFSIFSSTPEPKSPPWNPPRLQQQFEQFPAKENDAEAAYRRAAGKFYMPPGTRTLDPLLQQIPTVNSVVVKTAPAPPAVVKTMPVPPQRRFLNDAELKAISRRVQFDWPEGSVGDFKVEFSVELNVRGGISRLTKIASSGLPRLDIKVEEAIWAAAPFNEQIKPNFNFKMSWHREPAKEKTGPEKAPASDTPTP